MVSDPRTRTYVERRTPEGRSRREIIRSLKRYAHGSSIAIYLGTNPPDTDWSIRASCTCSNASSMNSFFRSPDTPG